MHYLNTSYSNWFKSKHNIMGVIFQGRYKSIIVDENNYALGLSAYIHLNPVRARIVSDIKEYKWSSYPDYIGRKRSIERLDTEFILRQFDDDLNRAKKKYKSFVIKNINMDNPLEGSYKGIALGNRAFIKKIKGKIGLLGRKREIRETKIAEAHRVEEIMNIIVDKFSIEKEEIFRKRRGNIYRQIVLYLIKRYSALSLKDIGKLFSMDYAAVSQACRRIEEKKQIDRDVLNKIKTVEKVLRS